MGDWLKRLWESIKNAIDDYKESKRKLKEWEITTDNGTYWNIPTDIKVSRKSNDNDFWEYLGSIYGDGDTLAGPVEIPSQPQTQEFSFNIPLTVLPKRYWCKTLILTLVASQPYEYQAVDMSQYEEKGLAHFIVGSPQSAEEMAAEYATALRSTMSAEELQEEEVYLQEVVQKISESGMHSFYAGNATLLHYESLGLWDIEDDDQEEE